MNNSSFEIHTNLLKKFFGFDSFLGFQQKALENLSRGESTFLIQSTGSGKSLCYLYPTAVWAQKKATYTLVLSPLIALIEDQSAKAKDFGLKALALHSQKNSLEKAKILQLIQAREFNLLYVTPERLRKPEFRQALQGIQFDLLVIDEAHCISQWGHDFRPDYSKIPAIQKLLNNPLTLALTATASLRVEKEVQDSLGIPAQQTLRLPIYRSNLEIQVSDLYGFSSKLEKFLESEKKPIQGVQIMYFSLISTLLEMAKELSKRKIQFLVYHGDLPPHDRKKNYQNFMQLQQGLLLATPAFGLGVDKKNIRKIIHFEIPGSLEAYTQEMGRAGRDGLPAVCELYFDEEDLLKQMEFIKWAHPEISFIKSLDALVKNNLTQFAQAGVDYLKEQLLFKNKRDYRVEASLQLLEKEGDYTRDEKTLKYQRMDEPDWASLEKTINPQRLKTQNELLLKMVQWAKQDSECRWQKLSEAFGETLPPCGHCDVCRK